MWKKAVSNVYEFASVIMSSIIAIALVFTFAFRLVGVSGQSMEPTLKDKDWLITSTLKSSYDQLDIIIAVQPGALNEPLVKRVIATENQWVTVDYDEGLVYVGDTPETMEPLLNETYIAEPPTVRPVTDMNNYPIQVPEGCVFAMGDNRNHSTDSRSMLVGFIDERYILGKAAFRALSGEGNKPHFDMSKVKLYD